MVQLDYPLGLLFRFLVWALNKLLKAWLEIESKGRRRVFYSIQIV